MTPLSSSEIVEDFSGIVCTRTATGRGLSACKTARGFVSLNPEPRRKVSADAIKSADREGRLNSRATKARECSELQTDPYDWASEGLG